MAENNFRRYIDSLLPSPSKAVDLGSWAFRWRKLWADTLEIRQGTVTDDPVEDTDIVNKAFVDASAGGTLTVEDIDSSPSYDDITTLQFDEADGFVITNPSAGVARIDVSIPTALTVREVDGTPSVTDVDTLEFAEADGFVVTDQTGGVARVELDNIPVTSLDGSFTDLGTTLTGSLPIVDGGTGAATAADARTNLDVPSNAEAILDTLLDAKGDLISATADDTPAILTVGANDTFLIADSAAATGLKWANAATARTALDVPSNAEAILDTIVDAAGDLIVATAADTVSRLAAGSEDDVLTIVSGVPAWAAAAGGAGGVSILNKTGTAVTVANNAAEAAWYSFTVPGGSFDADGMLRLTIHGIISGPASAASTMTFRYKYGATTVVTQLCNIYTGASGTAFTNFPFQLTFHLVNKAGTNAQSGYAAYNGPMGRDTGAVTAVTATAVAGAAVVLQGYRTDGGTAAEDSTGDLALAVTVDWNVASTTRTITLQHAILEAL